MTLYHEIFANKFIIGEIIFFKNLKCPPKQDKKM